MANKLLISLLFCSFKFATTPIYAIPESGSHKTSQLNTEACEAPPPDSFRIASISSNFISLAWKPVWAGAIYDISLFKKNSFGGWDLLYTIYNIPGADYTVNGLESGKEYRFSIATKCSTEDPSELTAIVDGIALILELTTAGRVPLYPTQVNCYDIDFAKYEWVGFKVTYWQDHEVISNFFEYKELLEFSSNNTPEITLKIKRVHHNNSIVAENENGIFPVGWQVISSINPFYMSCLTCDNGDEQLIGRVQLVRHFNPSTIDICPSPSSLPIWNNSYSFEVLVAQKVETLVSSGDDRHIVTPPVIGPALKAQTPFNETLNIVNLGLYSTDGKITVVLRNANGKIVIEENFDSTSEQLSFSPGPIPSGIYFLSVKNKKEMHTIKVLKIE